MKMEIGKRVNTPRFGEIYVNDIFLDRRGAEMNGYVLLTQFADPEWEIRAKVAGVNRFRFAAYRKK